MLKVWCDEKWVITEQRWRTLMQEACPQWSPARVALLWQVLDDNNDGKIGMLEWCFTKMPTSFPEPHWMGGRESLGTGCQGAMSVDFLHVLV